MTRSALLAAYRDVREAICAIHDAADAIGAHLDRVQIYGDRERLAIALGGARDLLHRVQALERTLQRCGAIHTFAMESAAAAASEAAAVTDARPAGPAKSRLGKAWAIARQVLRASDPGPRPARRVCAR